MTKQSVVLGATAMVSVAVVVGLFYASRRRAEVAADAAAEAARLTLEAEKAAKVAAESARTAADIEAKKQAKEFEKKRDDAEKSMLADRKVANAAAGVGVKAPASGANTEVATTVPKGEADLAPHASVAVCYGSQTGNAKAIAQDMFEMLSDAGVKCALSDLNSWKKWELPLEQTSLMVAVVSTTGNGDPPDNMEKFHRFLKKRAHPSDLLNKLEFAVLALGDTNYDKFCEMGKWLNQRLKELGASPFLPLGCADEGTGLEDVVEPWCADLKTTLLQKLAKGGASNTTTTTANTSEATVTPADAAATSAGAVITEAPQPSSSSAAFEKRPVPALLQSRNLLPFHEALGGTDVAVACTSVAATALAPNMMHKPAGVGLYTETFLPPRNATDDDEVEETKVQAPPTSEEGAPFLCEMKDARYLTVGGRSSERRVIHAEMKPIAAKAPPVPFKVGDSVGLRCANEPDDVQEVLRAVGNSATAASSSFSPEARVELRLSRSGLPAELPDVGLQGGNGCGSSADSVAAVLTWGIDLSSAIKPSLCAALATCCQDPLDRAGLMALSAKKECNGVDCFDLVVKQQSLRVAELLAMFPSCAPPLGLLIAALPPLAMRFYSIASSPLDQESSMAVAFSVVEWQTARGKKALRRGLCTPWLESALQTQVVPTGKDETNRDDVSRRQVVECTLKPSAEFTLPQDQAAPCILIGPGTGVAPFVGFLKHRSLQRKQLATCAAHATSRLEAAKATLAEITAELEKAKADVITAAPPPAAAAASGGKKGNGKRRNKRDKASNAGGGGGNTAAASAEANEHVTALRALHADATAEVALQEKEALEASQAVAQTKFGEMRLYFGCRHEEQDFLYREELAGLQAEGTLTSLRTAFSRDGPSKVYVQHKLVEDSALLKNMLLYQGAHLFVCGDGLNMARDVHLALVSVLASSSSAPSSNSSTATGGGVEAAPLTEEGAEAWLQAMKDDGKYVQDIWS